MTKIEAIERTIYNLENGVYRYVWESSTSCNAGLLCRTVIGREFAQREIGKSSFYTRSAKCMLTGIDVPLIFKTLAEAGFTYEDLSDVELLKNKTISEKAGLRLYKSVVIDNIEFKAPDFNSKENLLKYLKAWAEILKQEAYIGFPPIAPIPEPKPKEKIRYVSVPETINEQSKELILN